MSAEPPRRYRALDGLRGVAACLVVLFHIRWTNHVTDLTLVRNAYLAVDLFFILSGFVITFAYGRPAQPGRFSTTEFLILRFFRVYPLHLATLLFLALFEITKFWAARAGILSPGTPPSADGNSPLGFVLNLFLVQGLGTSDRLGFNSPSWSISVEFVAYLLFAAVAAVGAARNVLLLVACSVTGLVACAALALACGTLDLTFDYGLVRCLAGFSLGMMCFQLSQAGRVADEIGAISWPWLTASQIAVVSMLLGVMSWTQGAGVVLTIPLFAALILLLQCDRGGLAELLQGRLPQFLGETSYSIYMVHFPLLVVLSVIMKRVAGVAPDPASAIGAPMNVWVGDLLLAGSLLTTVLVATVSSRLIEEPGRRLGRRLARRQVPQEAGRSRRSIA